MDFIHVEGTQTEKPLDFDATTSKTIVYIRKNIERKTKTQDGLTYDVWEYDEAQLPMSDFNAIASALVSEQGEAIKAVTPVTMTKTAYIDDTECIFTEVPTGNMTVYCSVPHTVERDGDRVTVRFEPLEEVIEVTISII